MSSIATCNKKDVGLRARLFEESCYNFFKISRKQSYLTFIRNINLNAFLHWPQWWLLPRGALFTQAVIKFWLDSVFEVALLTKYIVCMCLFSVGTRCMYMLLGGSAIHFQFFSQREQNWRSHGTSWIFWYILWIKLC